MTVVNSRVMYPVQNSVGLITKMKTEFATLQAQLSTGKQQQNLADFGSQRYFDLAVRARQTRLDGYSTNITVVNSRLEMFDQATTALSSSEQTARGLITPSTYGSQDVVLGEVRVNAQGNLDQVINVLNSDINGRFLFGGSVTDKQPVTDMDSILNGVAGKAGFTQVANERQQADLGDGHGRLTIGGATDTVTLTEDAGVFGFKLSTLTASGSATTLTAPTGTPPQNLAVQFNSLPADGDTITIGLTLPDGTSDGITLQATTGTPGPGQFQIGVDPNTTAANFSAALDTALTAKAGTALVAASNNAAADNFFNGHGTSVMRVQPSPDFAHATALVAADPTTTVMWYTGGDSASPRTSIQARVDDAQTVSYGAQANENGTLNLVRALAVLSIQNFTSSNPNTPGLFNEIATRNVNRLSASHNSQNGSIQMLSIELNNAKVQVGDIKSRHGDYSAQLQGMVSDIENTADEETTAEILALQTRLQASYQTTSLLAHLSLVNYITT